MKSLEGIGDPRRVSNRRVESCAEEVSKAFAWTHADLPATLFTNNFDVAYDTFLYPEFGILLEEGDDLGHDNNGEKILGSYDALTHTVSLDHLLHTEEKARRTFTAWHEVGHAILHRKWILEQSARYEDHRVTTSASMMDDHTTDRLEQQANVFAAAAAAPVWLLDFAIKSVFRTDRPLVYRGPFKYSMYPYGIRKECQIDDFERFCMIVSYQIQRHFGGLSVQSLMYRVRASNWIIDATKPTPSTVVPLHRTVSSSAMLTV